MAPSFHAVGISRVVPALLFPQLYAPVHAARSDVPSAVPNFAGRVARTPLTRNCQWEITLDSTGNRVEAEVRVEARGDIYRHGSVDGFEVHVVVALKGSHPGIDVSIDRFCRHWTGCGIHRYTAVHGTRPHWSGGIPYNDTAVNRVRPHFGSDIAHGDAAIYRVSADLDGTRYADRDPDVRVVFVVAIVAKRLYAAILATRAVVPDSTDRDVAISLDDLKVDVVHFAAIRPLLGN